MKVNAAIKKLRGMNPNANWKNVNNKNLTNGQQQVLRGLKAGANYKGLQRQATAQAGNMNASALFRQKRQATAQAGNLNASALYRQKRQATAQAGNLNASALFKQAQAQGPKRQMKEIYDFPKEGTLKEVIQAVSQDVWKHFESRKAPAEVAWLVLKSRGQTVNRTPYRSGFIMDQYNWKELYDRFKDGSTPVEYKQIMRYVLAMLALNPPYANRKTGNRNKLTIQLGGMNGQAFNAYLKALKPVANQGGGLVKAALRTTASGAGLVTRTAINKKAIVLPIAAAALTAGLAGGPAAAGTAARMAAKQALKSAVVGGLKSKFGNNPISNAVINKAVSLAETKITSQTAPTNNSIKTAIANAANTAANLPSPTTAANINRKVAQAVELYVRQQRLTGNVNFANVARYKKNIRQKIINGTFDPAKATRQFNAATVKGQKTGLAIAGGALAAEGLAAAAAGKLAQKAATKAGSAATQQLKAMAKAKTNQAIRQGIVKPPVGPRAAVNVARRASQLNKAKMNFVKKLLNRAARGNHTITPNMINKAVVRAGGDPRVAHALEKGGQVARNLLATL